jgi:prepilin-type N-terminal cleavage/methylation domain-containing protein
MKNLLLLFTFIRGNKKTTPKLVSGFTLIELLVVIAIVGVLSSVVLASLNSARVKARNSLRVSTLRQLKNAFNMYYSDFGSYPSATACLGFNNAETCWIGGTGNTTLNDSLKPYINELSKDPLYGQRTAGNAYIYFNNTPTWHCTGTIFPYSSGPYIAWQPDKTLSSGDNSDNRCLGMGFMSCCDWNCSDGYYCTYPLQN